MSLAPISELGTFAPSRARELLPPSLSLRVMQGMIKQLGEKMDSVRRAAKRAIAAMLDSDSAGLWLPDAEQLAVLSRDDVDWSSFCALLSTRDYSSAAAQGLIISVGAHDESCTSALIEWCKSAEAKSKSALAATLLRILENAGGKDDRVALPCLRTAHLLLEAGAFARLKLPKSEWSFAMLEATAVEMERTKSVSKLSAGTDVLLGLAKYARPVRTRALACAISLLGHPYPMVRKRAAEQLHLFVLGSDAEMVCAVQSNENDFEPSTKEVMDMIEMLRATNRLQELEVVDEFTAPVAEGFDVSGAYDRVCDALVEVEWDADDVDEAHADELHDLMHVKRGCGIEWKIATRAIRGEMEKEDADFTYASLIHESEMGY